MRNTFLTVLLALMSMHVSAVRTIQVLELSGKTNVFELNNVRSISVRGGMFVCMQQPDSIAMFLDVTKIRTLTFSPTEVGLVTKETLKEQGLFSWKIRDELFMTFLGKSGTECHLEIYSTAGRKVLTKVFPVNPGENTVSVNIGELATGTYIGRMRNGNGKVLRLKFVR
jgi:hypothetical protein